MKIEAEQKESTPTPDPSSAKTEEECIICMEGFIETVFLECGHMACCRNCAKSCVNCPLCRRPISRVVNVFHAKK